MSMVLALLLSVSTTAYAVESREEGGALTLENLEISDTEILNENQQNNNRIEESFSFNFIGFGGSEKDVWGSLNYPNTLKHDKVFFFIHGRMMYNENAHLGFDYISEKLCELGYRTISLNICDLYNKPKETDAEISNVIKAVEETLKYIKKSENDFGDIKTISFIGHSRGGFHVFKVSEVLMKKGYNIESILSIAPCVLDWSRSSLPNTEITILVPEFDGDVSDLDGCLLYNESLKSKHTSMLRYLYLYGANHNFFSTEMLYDDTKSLNKSENYQKYRISKEVQQEFLVNTILKYMTIEDYKNIDLTDLSTCREYDFCRDYEKLKCVDLKSLNSCFITLNNSIGDYSNPSLSMFIEPGYKRGIYKSLIFTREDNFISLDILNNSYDEILFELAFDNTQIRDFVNLDDVGLEVIVEYHNGDMECFNIKPSILNGEITSNGKSWNRKIPFEQFYLDIDENKILDKIVIKCRTFAQFIINDVYLVN
jgi:hypothetical protein